MNKTLWLLTMSFLMAATTAEAARVKRVARKCDRKVMATVSQLQASVLSISDGDTMSIVFPDGATGKVRLLGMDAPEAHYMGQNQGIAGDEALGALQSILPVGSPIVLDFDKDKCDMYGRYLAFVGRTNANGQKIDVNGVMIAQGYAQAYCFRKNMIRCEEYTLLAQKADQAGLNIFRRYSLEEPAIFRRRVMEAAKAAKLPVEANVEAQ